MSKSLDAIDAKKLREAVNQLNDSGILGKVEGLKKIKVVGSSKQALYDEFCKAISTIVEEADKGKPELESELTEKAGIAVDFYNWVFAEGEESVPAEKPAEAPTEKPVDQPAEGSEADGGEKKKPGRPKKDKPPKEPKVRKGPPRADDGLPRSIFGHIEGTQAAKIDELLLTGSTLEAIAEACGCTKSRVKSHIKHLTEKNRAILTEKEGVWKAEKLPEVSPPAEPATATA